MSKKFITGMVSAIAVLALSAFSLWNAIALAQEMDAATAPAPLTAVLLCREAKANYGSRVESIHAKGLSLQLSPEDINYQVAQLKDYKKRICFEAKYGYPPPLTSARQLCKEAKKNLVQDIRSAKAKGLSLQIPAEDIKAQIKAIRKFKTKICKEAKTETGPLP